MIGSTPTEGPRASIKVRAALAGGLVFGLAAGLTVASWTDAERVGATFTASTFNLQTSVQGAAYVSTGGTTGTVTASAAGIYPGSSGTRYVSLKVKTAAVSVGGTVSLSAAANGGGGLTPVLRSRIVTIPGATSCASGVFTAGATYVAGSNVSYQMVSAPLAPSVPIAVAANGGGAEVHYCIELSIATATPQVTYQGTTATATWTVTGQS
jgi:predicted ribosomally synthesized peptide with SipW-like signal peptide